MSWEPWAKEDDKMFEDLHAENDKLRAFAAEIMSAWPASGIDGGDLQEIAIKHGLLEPNLRSEPCGEYCKCASDYGISPEEWADCIICYRKTSLLTGEHYDNEDWRQSLSNK